MKGIKKYKLSVMKQTSQGDVMYTTGKIVNNSVMSLCSDRW